MIESPRGDIEYDEVGAGPTVVLVPGTCSTGAAWRPVVARLEGGFRCVTTSLLGYGRTAERRSAGNTDISCEAEVIEAVIRRTCGPVHLVGHSFGGLVALAVAIRNRVSLQSLMILEAPAPDVLRRAGEQRHSRDFWHMARAYFAAVEAGDQTAIEIMIDFFGGPGTFTGWPERVRDYAVQTTPINLLDWQAASGFLLPPAVLARAGVPTLVACGGDSHPAMRRANALLAEGIPDASLATVAGASHFMISSHPNEVAGLIERHAEAARRGRPDGVDAWHAPSSTVRSPVRSGTTAASACLTGRIAL
jgi:pimeloyl-ACP methyl ester carboxylesterase